MATPAVVEIVASLFLTVSQLSGYPAPRELPPIHVLSEHEMAQRLCAGPCGVRAYYLDGQGVFLRDDLDIVGDLKARSILLHELVHHVQHENSRFGAMDSCERWFAREDEAYRIQNAYLSGLRTSLRFVFDYLPERCRETGSARN
ncbi:MAG: hypothetical protein K2Y35_08405 [Burkholderiales bacterium]|nr:hypothetical protein [Burkholderiales bacterium]